MKVNSYAEAIAATLAAKGDELAARGYVPDPEGGAEDPETYVLYMLPSGDPYAVDDGGLAYFVDKVTGRVWSAPPVQVNERLAAMTETT